MMGAPFTRNVYNKDEVQVCLNRALRRKGKIVAFAAIPSGSIIRFGGKEWMVFVDEAGGKQRLTFYDARGYLLGYVRIGETFTLDSYPESRAMLLMGPDEVIKPDFEPDVYTYVRFCPDGKVNCQNVICSLPGQYWTYSDYAAYQAARFEDEAKGPRRAWVEENNYAVPLSEESTNG